MKVSFHLLHAFESKLVMLGFNSKEKYWHRLENNKVKEKGMIVLSSAYKGGGRTDLSYNIEEAADHYTALQCAVTDHIGLWYLNLLQYIILFIRFSTF